MDDLLKLLKSRLSVSRNASKKWRKNVELWLQDYNIESFENIDFDDLHNQLQVPYIFTTIESGLPSMFENMPSIIMTKRGKLDKEFTLWTERVWDYIVEKTNLEENVENVGIMSLIAGLSQLRWGWKLRTKQIEQKRNETLIDPDTKLPVIDETGKPVTQEVIEKVDIVVEDRPMLEFYNYDKVYYSPESSFVMDDTDNKIPYIICEKVLTPDEVKDIYGVDPDEQSLEMLDITDENGQSLTSADIKKRFSEADLKRLHVYYYFGVLPKKYAPKGWASDSVYKIVFSNSQILSKPEEIDKKPIVLLGNYGTPVEFERFGEPKVLRELEQDVSLGRSILADYRDRVATKIALPHGTEVDEDALKAPRKFQIVRFIGQQYPQYIAPPNVPESVVINLSQSRSDIQLASAQLDLARGGTTSVVDTATGQKIFEAATQRRIARKRRKIGKFIKYIAKNLLVLSAQNWDIETFVRITDEDPQKVADYVERLKLLGEDYDIKIKVEDLNFNKEARKAQAIAMYRELKDNPLINQHELIKEAIQIGFDEEDADRFLNNNLSPEQMAMAVDQLVQMGVVQPDMAEQVKMSLMQPQIQGQIGAGRPSTQNPVDVINKSMPGADVNQIQAQNSASYKQVGVPK